MCIKEEYKEACETKNLEECKNACASTDGCTAFNYHVDSDGCGFRKCSEPVVDPTDSETADKWGFKGYRIKRKFERVLSIYLL